MTRKSTPSRIYLHAEAAPYKEECHVEFEVDNFNRLTVKMGWQEFSAWVERLVRRQEALLAPETKRGPPRRHQVRLGTGEQSVVVSLETTEFHQVVGYLKRRLEAGAGIGFSARLVQRKSSADLRRRGR